MLWDGWLVTAAACFRMAGFFQQHYLSRLGAPLAARVAVGMAFMWRSHATHPMRAALLLLRAASVTLAYQLYAVNLYQSSGWCLTVPVARVMAGLGLLAPNLRWNRPALMHAGFVVIAIAMLVVPSVWSGLTIAYASGQTLPQAYGNTNGGASSSWTFSSLLQTLTGSGHSQSAQSGGMVQRVNQSLLA
jgi:hypothetical protein